MKSGSCKGTKGNSQTKSSLCPFLCLSPAMWSAVLSRARLVQATLVCTGRRKAWRMRRFPREMFSCTSPASLCTRFGKSMYSQVWWHESEEAAVLIFRIHESKGFQHTQPLLPQFLSSSPPEPDWQFTLTERSFGAGYTQKKPQKIIFAFQQAEICSLKKSESPKKLFTKENLPTVIHPLSVRTAWNQKVCRAQAGGKRDEAGKRQLRRNFKNFLEFDFYFHAWIKLFSWWGKNRRAHW